MRDGVLQIPSMKDRCSPEEWQARVDLAACYRLVELYGMADMMANHISVRVPGEENAFLINAYGMMYEEITASSLIKVDLAGNILSKPDFGDAELRHQQGRLRDPQRGARGAARGRLRDPHAQLGVDGGFVAGLRAAADHADGDALPEDRLSRLPGRGARTTPRRSR